MGDLNALDWLTPLADRGPVPGLERPLAVTLAVPKTAEGDLAFTATFEAEGAEGGDADEVELTAAPAVADALAAGTITPNVAWMSGRLKAAGPTGPLLAVLAVADAAAG
jgi:putative sterol carrier protein